MDSVSICNPDLHFNRAVVIRESIPINTHSNMNSYNMGFSFP